MLRIYILIVLSITLTGCVDEPSEEDIQQEWSAFVAERNSCETVDDCTVIGPGCPLGCSAAINKMYEEEALERADELVSEYQRGGQTCAYNCVAAEPLCEENTCQAEPQF